MRNSLQKPRQLIFHRITKITKKSFECPKSIRYYEKKILGTSNTWLTIHLSHWPIEPAYHVLDWQSLNDLTFVLLWFSYNFCILYIMRMFEKQKFFTFRIYKCGMDSSVKDLYTQFQTGSGNPNSPSYSEVSRVHS